MRILRIFSVVIFTLLFTAPNLVVAQGFTPLVGIPGLDANNLSTAGYINALYILSISVAAFLAVARIILAGLQYMLSDVVTDKSSARKQITGSILGLLIVIGAVLILETINPRLTDWSRIDNIPSYNDSIRGGIEVVGSQCPVINDDGECVVSRTDAQRLREQNVELNETLEQVEITEEEQEALGGAEGADAQMEVQVDIREQQADFGEANCSCTFPDRQAGNPGRPRGCLGVEKIFNNGTFIGFQCRQVE